MSNNSGVAAVDPSALHAQLQDYRRKITRGEEVTDDELRDGIAKLQAYRNGAHTTLEAAAKKAGTKKVKKATKAESAQKAKNLLGGLL